MLRRRISSRLACLLVGISLLWGFWMTLNSAMALFQ
jgi:hypothetical protein